MVFTGYCRVLSPAVIAVLIGMAGGCTATEKDRAPFSVVLLPDTQNYSEKYPGTYLSQTCWIKDRAPEGYRVLPMADCEPTGLDRSD